jgi:hypothetical protein
MARADAAQFSSGAVVDAIAECSNATPLFFFISSEATCVLSEVALPLMPSCSSVAAPLLRADVGRGGAAAGARTGAYCSTAHGASPVRRSQKNRNSTGHRDFSSSILLS